MDFLTTWMLLFYICTPVCDKTTVDIGTEPYIRKTERVLFYKDLGEARLVKANIKGGIKLNLYGIKVEDVLCSEVQMWRLTNEKEN